MLSRTTSVLLVLFGVAAIVAAAAADTVARGSVQEVSRRAGKNKYSYYHNSKKDKNKKQKNDVEDKCIIPHIDNTTGVVTSASCTSETMSSDYSSYGSYSSSSYYGSSYYEYYGKKNKYNYKNKYNKKTTTTCCDGYLCNDGSAVNNIFAKVGGDKCALNETTAANVTAHQCCLPAGVDITGFVCEAGFIDSGGYCNGTPGVNNGLKIDVIDAGSQPVANELSCICCGGFTELVGGTFFSGRFDQHAGFKVFCRDSAPSVGAPGQCPHT